MKGGGVHGGVPYVCIYIQTHILLVCVYVHVYMCVYICIYTYAYRDKRKARLSTRPFHDCRVLCAAARSLLPVLAGRALAPVECTMHDALRDVSFIGF